MINLRAERTKDLARLLLFAWNSLSRPQRGMMPKSSPDSFVTFRKVLNALPLKDQEAIIIDKLERDERRHVREYCMFRLRGMRSERVIELYKESLRERLSERIESVLINIDFDNLATVVGTDLIRTFLVHEDWAVRARAAAILFQEGKLGRPEFLGFMRNACIPDIDKDLVTRYVNYLKRRTLRMSAKAGHRGKIVT